MNTGPDAASAGPGTASFGMIWIVFALLTGLAVFAVLTQFIA